MDVKDQELFFISSKCVNKRYFGKPKSYIRYLIYSNYSMIKYLI